MGDTTGTGDAGGIGSADNNTNGKNAYTKAGFSTYNVTGVNADAAMSAGDTNGIGEEVSNNTNNTGEDESGGVGGADKSGLGGTNKVRIDETNIEVGVEVGGANKGGIGGADNGGMGRDNKSGMGGTNIEAGKKASAVPVASIDNSANNSDKITD